MTYNLEEYKNYCQDWDGSDGEEAPMDFEDWCLERDIWGAYD